MIAPRKTRSSPTRALGIGLALLGGYSAHAVPLTANDPAGASSFNTAGRWSDLLAPSAGKTYETGAFILRSPVAAATFTFAGDQLTINGTTGRLLGKTTGAQTLTIANLVLDGGTLDQANANNSNARLTLAGNITVNSASRIGALLGETLDITAPISGAASLTVGGSTTNAGASTGLVILSAANPFSGTLQVGSAGWAFNAGTGTASGLVGGLRLGHLQAAQNATVHLLATRSPSSVPLQFSAATNTGPFLLGGLSGGSALTLADTAGSPVALEVGGNGADTSFAGALSGPGSLVKTGSGTLTLAGSTTLSADLAVRAGTLALAGGSLAAPSLTLANGSTLDVSGAAPATPGGLRLIGAGAVRGSLTLDSESELHPGGDGAVGSLTFQNDLTLASGATLHLDLGASENASDHLGVAGTLSLSRTTVHLRASAGLASLDPAASYLIATAGGITGQPEAEAVWLGAPPTNADEFRVVATATGLRLQAGATPLYAVGSAGPSALAAGERTLLVVDVTPGTGPASTGLSVTADLAPLGGAAGQTFYDDGTHGDRVAGDHRFSYLATLAAGLPLGPVNLNATATDAEARVASASLAVSVVPAIATRYLSTPFLAVSELAPADGFAVAADGFAAPIHYSATDATVVRIAAEALRDDVERVTGLVPGVSTAAPAPGSTPILVGTLGASPLIDGLVASGRLDVSAIQGRWEAYVAAVVTDPLPGIARALVIAGSDRRGTAFGVFGLSEAMGVSPWYFWGDVPTTRRTAIHVADGIHVQPTPGVKYRGIFLNDEDWGLQPWAAKTFEPELGNIGPKTYATIFELLLRLHANVIWPAMHEFPVETTPFYLVPGNKETADAYAIVISTSHHEPMLRNSHEYDTGVLGPYNYWTNRDTIYNFWEQRVIGTAGYENIYTLGMRGRDDSGMLAPAGTTNVQKAAKIQNEIIPDQRKMIADHVNPDPSQVPQIFIPYKETLVQYQSGLQLPDDVTIVWPDDNHGYIRQLSTAAERARSGGSGVYYHLSYWGVPRSYLWFCTTPPGMTRSEMMKAWDFDARRYWLVNVGDLKPHEIGADFFLRLARDPEAFRDFDQHAYLTEWAARSFGPLHAEAIADVLEEYYSLNIAVRPEHLDRSSSGFDFTGADGRGDQARDRLERFAALRASAEAIHDQLSGETKSSFYSLVLFSVRASHQVNQKVLLAERSRLWAAQGRAATGSLAAEALAADAALGQELAFYNLVNAGGKWNFMFNPMSASQLPGWAQETQSPFYMSAVGSLTPPASAGLGVVVEGSATPLAEGETAELATFERAADSHRFIDVFNTGSDSLVWTATASEAWVLLSHVAGDADTRIRVSIDWTRAPRGHALPATVTIRGAGATRVVRLKVFNPLGLDLAALPAAFEDNGRLTLPAANYATRRDAPDGTGWRPLSQATAGGDGMSIAPVTAPSIAPATINADTPSLTYEFHAFRPGSVVLTVKCLPTHRITSEHPGLRYAISLNGDTPQVIDVHANEYTSAWNANVIRAYSAGISRHRIAAAGRQTLKIHMIDPGVVLDRIEVRINPGTLEAETLEGSSNGAFRTFTESIASAGAALSFDATGVGKQLTLALPDLAAGAFDLGILAKKGPSRGIAQLSIADSASGPFTAVGGPIDLYASALAYVELPPLRLQLATAGTKYLRFEVVGKNSASSNHWIVLDRFAFSAVSVAQGPLQSWREVYFGRTDGAAEAADLADPDGDGMPNLLEYATGSSPTANNPPFWKHEVIDRHLSVSFPWLKDATDITYRVLAGDRLDDMAEIWTGAPGAYPGGAADFVLMTVTDPFSFDTRPSRFIRLSVSSN